ncbi:MAG: hypothetical protein Q7U47_01400 [Paludibacter sp.]|nr:hypothetical protein [Paludibacter sp.]
MIVNKITLIKALCKLRKSKRESLKNALVHDRHNIAAKRTAEIKELDAMIDKMERKTFAIIF